MEFRTCPACKASVLEDDVEDCPFCGASMSGKPSASPPTKPAVKPTARTPAPATKQPASPSIKGAASVKPASAVSRPRPEPEPEKSEDNADPFEVDPQLHKQAAQVAIKAGKGRTIEVKCPMCETIGFIAPTQAGKDVKCCNPSCRLPIFKAPRLPEAPKVEPEKSKGLSVGMLALLAILGLGGVGGAVYWFVFREEPKPISNAPTVPDVPIEPREKEKHRENVVVLEVKREVTDLAEMRTLALQGVLKLGVQHDIRNKSLGRKLSAEALLITGDLLGAKEQIDKIGTAPSVLPYTVEPLALLAHQQLDAGDRTSAEATLNDAVEKATKLPNILRSHSDTVIVLAAALVRFNRTTEAESLLAKFEQTDKGGRSTLSEMWRASLDQGTFDFEYETNLSQLELSGHPLRVASAIHLCRHGQWDVALTWCQAAKDQVVRDASFAACAGMMAAQLARRPDPTLENKLTTTIDKADLAAKVRMINAVDEVRLLNGDASVTLAKATETAQLLASVTIPSPMKTPGMSEIYHSKGSPFAGLPDPAPGTSLALAFADVADLQMKLGDQAAGWKAVGQAMQILQSVSPSPTIARQLFEQSNNQIEAVKGQLDAQLKLGGNEAKKRLALSQYRGQCEELLKVADRRFSLQQTVLRRAMRHGLFQEVWRYMQEQEQAEPELREPYRTGSELSQFLYYRALSHEAREFLEQTWKELTPVEQDAIKAVEPTAGLLGSLVPLAKSGKYREAAESLKPLYAKALVDRHLIDRHVLEQSSIYARDSVSNSYTYVQRLADPTIREDAMRLLAGLSVQRGTAPELWKLIETDREIPATDKASAYLGFLEGIQMKTGK